MTLLFGAMLAAGLLPWLWPPRAGDGRGARRGRLALLVEEAGLSIVEPRFVLVGMAATGLAAAALAWLLSGLPVLALLAGAAGAVAPVLALRARRLRMRKVRRQLWPDVCDLLVASIRVGLSLPDAVAALADSAPTILRPAFVVSGRDLRATGRFDASLDRLKSSLADPVADRIIETLPVRSAAPSSPVFSGRSRRRSGRMRRCAARWRRDSPGSAVLGAVAPWVILGLLVMRPEGAAVYATPEGVLVICVVAAVSVLAFRIMIRIGRLPEPGRWFG